MRRPKKTDLEEFADTRKELENLELSGKLFKRGSREKAHRLLKSVIRPQVYDQVLENFGASAPQILDRAASEIARSKALADARRIKEVSAYRSKLIASGLSPRDAYRALPPVKKRRPIKTAQYFKAPNTPGIKFRNQWVRVAPDGSRHRVTKTQAKREIAKRKYNEKIARLANKLIIPRREAQQLYRDVRRRAMVDLERFKKSATYRNLDPKYKGRFTKKRWSNASLAAMFQLLEIGSP